MIRLPVQSPYRGLSPPPPAPFALWLSSVPQSYTTFSTDNFNSSIFLSACLCNINVLSSLSSTRCGWPTDICKRFLHFLLLSLFNKTYFQETELKSIVLSRVRMRNVKILLKSIHSLGIRLSWWVSYFFPAVCLGSELLQQVNVSRKLGESFQQLRVLMFKCYFENISG